MGVLEQITQMKNQGIPDQEIVSNLQEQGISPKEINDALSQAQIKNAVTSPDQQGETAGGYANPTAQEMPAAPVNVRIERLVDFVDIDRITRLLKENNIIFLKTGDLQRQDIGEFENCVQKLKRVCSQNSWDIVGTEEGYLVLTPTIAKIIRQP